jgi:hypothetical protein
MKWEAVRRLIGREPEIFCRTVNQVTLGRNHGWDDRNGPIGRKTNELK